MMLVHIFQCLNVSRKARKVLQIFPKLLNNVTVISVCIDVCNMVLSNILYQSVCFGIMLCLGICATYYKVTFAIKNVSKW